MKQLLSTIEALQQQQAHAEAARLAADEAARSAGLQTQELERQLHESECSVCVSWHAAGAFSLRVLA